MAFRIPGTNFKIGKDKKKSDKKAVLDKAYKKVLASGTGDSKVTWPEMKPGTDLWYDEEQGNLRKATAAGLMREAERSTPNAPLDYKLVFDHPRQNDFGGGPRAFSSSEGIVNLPSDLAGYFSKPQYLASILGHEVAHNSDYRKNKPKVPHNKETFRPLEKAAMRASALEPLYNPGDDIGIGGENEYPDEYRSLGPFKEQYFLSANEMDPTRNVFPVDTKALAREIINRRNMKRSGPIRGGGITNLGGPNRGFQI